MSEIDKEIYIAMRGADSEVGVRVPMEHYYRGLMEAVEPSRDAPDFMALVTCVIWGSLYIEATVNRVALDVFLEDPFGSSEGGELWALAERADLENKVKVMAERCKVPKDQIEHYLRILRRLAKIRNRLVHYKERFTKVDPSPLFAPRSSKRESHSDESPAGLSMGGVSRELQESLASPHIVHAVQGCSLAERKREFASLGEWIAALRRSERTVIRS